MNRHTDTIKNAKRLAGQSLPALREALIQSVTALVTERGRDGVLPIFSERSSGDPKEPYGHHISIRTGGYCVRYCAQCLKTFSYRDGGTGVIAICEDESGDTQEITVRHLDTDQLASLCEALAGYSDGQLASARRWWECYTEDDGE